jgi:hypothetical protein
MGPLARRRAGLPKIIALAVLQNANLGLEIGRLMKFLEFAPSTHTSLERVQGRL